MGIWKRSFIWLDGRLFVQLKERGDWVFEVFLYWIGPSLESGVGDMLLKGSFMEANYRGEVWERSRLAHLWSQRWLWGWCLESFKGWDLFFSKTLFEVGNDRRVKFWTNRWCVKEPLCNFFASLYALASLKEAWVADLWEDLGGGGGGETLVTAIHKAC